MAKGLNLKAVLSLEHRAFTKGLNNIKNQLRGFSNMLKSAFALGSITMFGKQMIQVGADFENAMARVQAVSNATTKEFQAMQKEAQRLGATTRYTATEAANALENLTRNGLSASDATKALSGVLQLAQANAIELANAADILTNTMNAFGLSVTEVQRVNDVMSSTASHAATNINELYEAMTVAGPYAKIMGGSIEEAAAAIGVLANKGIKGSTAGKALAAMYQRLSAITPKAAKELQKYGLNIDEAVVKSQSLDKTLKQLADSGIGKSVEALTNLFGKNYAGDIAQLINSTDELDDMLTTLANSAGTTERMFNQGIGSVTKELDTLKSMYEDLLITISQKTSGTVHGAIRLLQNLILNFKSVGGTLMNIASVIVPLVAKNVVALGRTIKTVSIQTASAVATAKALVGGLIPLIATLVTWVGTALVGAWNRNHQAMKEVNQKMEDFKRETERVKNKMNDLLDVLGTGKTDHGTIAYIVNELTQEFPTFADAIIAAGQRVEQDQNWDAFKGKLERIAELKRQIEETAVKESEYDAGTQELGRQLWNLTGFRLGSVYDSKSNFFNQGISNDMIVRAIGNDINDAMRKNGLNKNDRKNQFNEIAKIIRNPNTSVDEAAKELSEELKKKGIATSHPQEFMKEYVAMVRRSSLTSAFFVSQDELQGNKTEQLRSIGRQVDSLKTQTAKTQADIFEDKLNDIIGIAQTRRDNKEIGEEEYKRITSEAVNDFDKNLHATFGTNLPEAYTKKLEELYKSYPTPRVRNAGDPDTGGGKKSDADKIKDLLDDYNKGFEKLENRKKAGTITDEEYNKELQDLNETTVESISAFSNLDEAFKLLGETAEQEYQKLYSAYQAAKQKDAAAAKSQKIQEENQKKADILEQRKALAAFRVFDKAERSTLYDFEKSKLDIQEEEVEIQFNYADSLEEMKNALQTAIKNGQFDEIKVEALAYLGALILKCEEAKKEANNMNEAIAGARAVERFKELQKQFKETVIDGVETAASAFERLYRSIQDIAEVFGQDLEWEGMEKVIKLINAGVTIFETFKSVIDAIKTAEDLYQQMHTKNAAKTVTENLEIAASEEIKSDEQAKDAIAGGASSVANIPYVGAALAVAAAAAVAAALMTNMNKYASGGIIGGSSYSGDKQVARVNAGEMIINRHDQATLFNAIKSGNLGSGGNVQFEIKGDRLIGVMENYKSKKRG